MERKLIKDLRDKDAVDHLFLLKDKQVAVGKNGRPFMSLLLGDASGQIDGRVWDNVESLSREVETGDVVKLKGAIQIFQNRKQLVIHRMEKVDASTVNFDDFIPKSSKNPEDLFAELLKTVKSMSNPSLRQLTLDTLEDPEIRPLFLKAPAAKSIHHAWIGGLLEHVLSIVKIMEFMAAHYSFLNRDLLIFGAVFHDIGKVWELRWEQGISYTNRGRLIGHMEMACELIDRKSSKILGFDAELRDICKHIVLSHHGKLEYGSP
ncbi:MAG TPA: HD domain-containing protein [Pseudobdellovibrionaceae bacterium]|nr:HD domain-containing protein [Pseudobdellovibrionaceae bacterium]